MAILAQQEYNGSVSNIFYNEIKSYCKEMLFNFTIVKDKETGIGFLLNIDDTIYKIVSDKCLIIDDDLDFLPQNYFNEFDNFFYKFGGRFYTHKRDEDFCLREAKYIGTYSSTIDNETFLGIRSGHEIMNGIGMYDKWLEKAKFLGINSLGICEKNTLSGVISFQSECKKSGIKPIFGLTVSIFSEKNDYFDIKLYAKNFQGWQSLLKFNSEINVNENKIISLDFFKENLNGLFVIADPKSLDFRECPIDNINFFQLDTVEFISTEKDAWYINNLKKFILSGIEPIATTDAFYLEKRDYKVREKMWMIAKSFDDKTNNQFFKSKEEYAIELIKMFDKQDKSWVSLFNNAVENEAIVANSCNFKYDTSSRHLPAYSLSEKDKTKYGGKERMFLALIEEGLIKKGVVNSKEYLYRVQKEIKVLQDGDVIDYFLVLYDIIEFAKDQKMITGLGRGSAAGSLIAYLLEITHVDPLEFDLLFERFLNEGRMGSFETCVAYKIDTDEGIITVNEKTLINVLRDSKKINIFVEDLLESDEILKIE